MTIAEDLRNRLFLIPELFMTCPRQPPARLQFRWQVLGDFTRSTHVETSPPIASFDEAEAWLEGLSGRYGPVPPEGMVPLVCTPESDCWTDPVV